MRSTRLPDKKECAYCIVCEEATTEIHVSTLFIAYLHVSVGVRVLRLHFDIFSLHVERTGL